MPYAFAKKKSLFVPRNPKGVERNRLELDRVKEFMDYTEYISREPKATPSEEHREGPVARSIEQQTAKLPSDLFLWAAFGSIAASLLFQLTGNEQKASFIGHWAPTFLSLGIYNKMVKLHGSEGV
jgi:hypothetical protein